MYKEDEQKLYYVSKLFLSLMFDNSQKAYKDIPNLYDIHYLNTFKSIIDIYAKQEWLTPNIKNNIYKILVDGRNIDDEYYKDRIEIINQIIHILNNSKSDKANIYYKYEAYCRRKNWKEINKWTIEKLQREIPYIENSICNDFAVLCSHSDSISEEEFLEEFLPAFTDNTYYYESLNIILSECPSMFKDKTFAKRVNQILSVNKNSKEISKRVKKLVKKTIKEI